MRRSTLSTPWIAARFPTRPLAALIAAGVVNGLGLAGTLPTAPETFDTTYTASKTFATIYAAPTRSTLKVAAGGDLQAALDKAQLGDLIVLQAGATFTGPYRLPNKTSGSGWIYVVSSNLSNLPPAGTRVSPANASDMPKLVAPNGLNALTTVANSHHFRFVGIEFAPAASAKKTYQIVAIGNSDTSPATLPKHIVFDRCYVHGRAAENHRRGIELDGAYVAVVDSYISDFQEVGADSQGLAAWNTTGPLQIRNSYIEAAGENVMFGGADSREAALVPTSIEIRNNYFFKPLSLIATSYNVKNLLEFKAAQRVLVAGNTFENNPAKSQNGFAVLITPRNQGGNAPWSVTTDIAITGNTFVNIGSGFNILGRDDIHPSQLTERVLVRDNIVGVSGLNGAHGRAFQTINGGSDYTIDHNTIITTGGSASAVMMADTAKAKVSNLTFTNNLATRTSYGFFGSGVGQGTPALNSNYNNWAFSKNVLVDAPAASYPAGNFFPNGVAAVRFVNYAGGNYALAADSPYKSAGSDGRDIGADVSAAPSARAIVPNPPSNVVVR
jgi:hypothetical protein